jgi:hypothetical protein
MSFVHVRGRGLVRDLRLRGISCQLPMSMPMPHGELDVEAGRRCRGPKQTNKQTNSTHIHTNTQAINVFLTDAMSVDAAIVKLGDLKAHRRAKFKV